jgi:hypothetical protein
VSVSTITYVHCDGCGDPIDDGAQPGDTAADQRADARLDGWAVSLPGGRDLCPDCRPDRGSTATHRETE